MQLGFRVIGRMAVLLAAVLLLGAGSLVNRSSQGDLFIIKRFAEWNKARPDERVYVMFDKTLYNPGETVWFTAFVKQAEQLTTDTLSDVLHVEVVNPKGSIQAHLKYLIVNGKVNGNFTFGSSHSGGVYRFRAYTMWQLNDSTTKIFEKEVTLQKAVLPNLVMKLDFEEKGYLPGQMAIANLHLKSLDNLPLKQQAYTYTVLVNGEKQWQQNGTTNDEGKARINCIVPVNLQTADILLNVRLTYNGTTESVARNVPVNLKNVRIEFYPEGGNMVAGVTSNIAFAAVDEWGKPVNVSGMVYRKESDDEPVPFSAYHHGMGKFALTAVPGGSYYAVLNETGDKQYPLPEVKSDGLIIEAGAPVGDKYLPVTLKGNTKGKLVLAAQMRGRVYYSQVAELQNGQTNLQVNLADIPMGVLQLTAFSNTGLPLAERLVFVNQQRQLQLQITTNKEKYRPRERVKVTVKARDERNKPVEGDICVAVVDDKVLSLANDKQGHILSQLLLEADVDGHIEEPNFYFDKDEPKAPEALNLLMMTRGWRRFVWQQVWQNDTTPYAIAMEKAVIAGEVSNFKEGKPAKGALVQVMGTDVSAHTDNNGRFELYGVDLSSVQTLAVRRGNKELYYNVNEYGVNHRLNFNNGRQFTAASSNTYRPPVNTPARPVRPPRITYENGNGKVVGRIVDENGEGLIAANIVCENPPAALKVRGWVTDMDGNFETNALPTGTYRFKVSYVGFETQYLQLEVRTVQNTRAQVYMAEASLFLEIVTVSQARAINSTETDVVATETVSSVIQRNTTVQANNITNMAIRDVWITGSRSLIESSHPLSTSQLRTIPDEKLQQVPVQTITDLLATVPGVVVVDEEVHVRGAREGSTAYYIDGVKVNGRVNNISLDIIDQVRVYTGHLPARYGDATGGVVEITTRGPGSVNYYSAPQTMVSVLNEGVHPVYSVGRQFPQIVHKPGNSNTNLYDDRKTIFWSGAVQLDESGQTQFEFYNTDELSTFKITAEGISNGGLVGRAERGYAVQAPVWIEAKFPVQAVNGDTLEIPVVFGNATAEPITLTSAFTIPAGWVLCSALPKNLTVGINSTATVPLVVKATTATGTGNFVIDANHADYHQKLVKQVNVKGAGYPAGFAYSASAANSSFDVELKDVADSTLTASFTVFASGISSLLQGVQGMISRPHGCFEQVSSTTYPNIMALQLLQKAGNDNNEVQRMALEYIEDGYKKLAAYEVPGGGFDLYGQAPANIPMTAYGLLQFVEMKKVYEGVSNDLINRTRTFLKAQKNKDGSFNTGTKSNYYYGVKYPETANAYIAWALSEAGETNVADVANNLYSPIIAQKDPYLLALLANLLGNLGYTEKLQQVNALLAATQQANGGWVGLAPSITGSTGSNLHVEASALALLALNRERNKYQAEILNAFRYLISERKNGGRFGATQATVLALKAITTVIEGTAARQWESNIDISVNGKLVHTGVVNALLPQPYIVEGLQQYMHEGTNRIQVSFNQPDRFSAFTFGANWQTLLPQSSNNALVSLTGSILNPDIPLGETVRLQVELKNKLNVPVPNPVAIVEVPSGLSLQLWQLKEMKEKGLFAYYEFFDNSLVLYFTRLEAGETKLMNFDLKTEVKGTYRAAASTAYLYYTDDEKHWSPGVQVKVR